MVDGQMFNYLAYPEADVLVEYVYKRFRQGLGTTIFVIGLPGTGKSSSCIRLGELISQRIHKVNKMTENNIADSLLKTVKFVKETTTKGEILVIEELAVLFPSTRAMSKDNVTIGKIMDTIRKKQIILITNAPVLKHIDSHMRTLGNILVETQKIVKTYQIVVSKLFRLQTNPMSGKTYFHKLTRDNKDVDMIYTMMPEQEIWTKYENEKDSFLGGLYQKLEDDHLLKLDEDSAKINRRKMKLKKINQELELKDLSPRELEFYNLRVVRRLEHSEIRKIMGVTNTRTRVLEKNIRRKIGQKYEDDIEIHKKIPIENVLTV